MDVKFSENEIVGILKCYYKKKNNNEYRVSMKVEECYGDAYLHTFISGFFPVLDQSFYAKVTLDEGELVDVLTEIFNKAGYDVHSIELHKGITEERKGYLEPYFTGISLNITNKKNKIKSIGSK